MVPIDQVWRVPSRQPLAFRAVGRPHHRGAQPLFGCEMLFVQFVLDEHLRQRIGPARYALPNRPVKENVLPEIFPIDEPELAVFADITDRAETAALNRIRLTGFVVGTLGHGETFHQYEAKTVKGGRLFSGY